MLLLTKKKENELIDKMIMAIDDRMAAPTVRPAKIKKAEGPVQSELGLVSGLSCVHCGSNEYRYHSVAYGVTRYLCLHCERTFQAEYSSRHKAKNKGHKGLLIFSGHHSSVVKYQSRFLVYLGDKRSDILLQSKDRSVAMSATRAVERCVTIIESRR